MQGPTSRLSCPRTLVISLFLLLAACGAPPDVPPAPTPVAAATAIATASPAATATLTPSPTSSPTAAPTPSPTPSPTATLTPSPTPLSGAAAARATAVAQAELPPLDEALAAELQRILDQSVADGFIPGATLAVNLPGHQPWLGASGIADWASGEPMNPNTRVRIASISKVFTAVVALQLVEEGHLDLDAPVSTWLPDLVPAAEQISVRNLLNHTSGLYDYLEDRNYNGPAYGAPDRLWAPEELVAYAAQFRLLFPPGTQGAWDYSSTNYVILGMIIQQVSGNTLAQEIRIRILDPLGMDSTYSPPYEEIQGARAHGYFRDVDQTAINMSFAFGTAGLVSTPNDVQRFGQALFNGQLMRPETLDLMYQFESGQGQYGMPDLAYGLGVMRNRLPVGPGPDGLARAPEASTVLGHIGGFGGFRSALWHAPEGNVTVVLGVNQGAMDPNTLATRVFAAILAAQGR